MVKIKGIWGKIFNTAVVKAFLAAVREKKWPKVILAIRGPKKIMAIRGPQIIMAIRGPQINMATTRPKLLN